jgi:hypothetical protein
MMKNSIISLFVGIFLFSCVAVPGPVNSDTDIQVLVLGEDSDKRSVRRSSDIFRRVMAQMQEQMSRYNYHVVDEDMIAAALDWKFSDRRPKQELIEVAKLANQARDPRVYSRALVIFKIRASAKSVGYATKAQVRIAGEVYDLESNRFLGAWEAPRMTFPAPKDCSSICIQEVVGDNARDIASSVSDVLRKKLAHFSRGSGSMAGSSGGGKDGLETTYAFTFRNFSTQQFYEFTEVMEKEFPKFVRAMSPQGDAAVMKYGYVSRAPGNKITKWVNLLLMDMGMNPDSDTKVTIRGTAFDIDNIVGSPASSQPSKSGRFN